jgi:hypothetical protein
MKSYIEESKTEQIHVADDSADFNALKSFLDRQNKILAVLKEMESKVDGLLKLKANSQSSSNSDSLANTFDRVEKILSKIIKPTVGSKKIQVDHLVHDITVQIDPNQALPLSLFVLIRQFFAKYKCFMQFHTSRTVKKPVQIESNHLAPAESRLNYDYGFTIIWTELKQSEPIVQLAKANGDNIIGESNILRYFNELLTGKEESCALVENAIDELTNCLSNEKNAKSFLANLNQTLKNSKWICTMAKPNEPSICDYYYWSRLNCKKSIGKDFEFLNKWLSCIQTLVH